MKWFYNLKISAKLITSFILVAMVAGAIGVISINSMQKIISAGKELYSRDTVPATILGQASEDFQLIRVRIRDVIINETMESKNKSFNLMHESDKAVNEGLAAFEESINTKETQDLYNNLKQAFDVYFPVRDKVAELALAGKTNESVALLNGEYSTVTKKVNEEFDKLVQRKIDRAKVRSDQNVSLGKNAIIITIVFMALGMLLAIGLGIFISRSISKPLKKAVEVADKLSLGDINQSITAASNDETGALMRSIGSVLNSIRDLVSETNSLTNAALDGKLDTRGNAEKFTGGYNEIVGGINKTLDAVIEPVKEASEVLSEMSKGNLNVSVRGSYKGDHAKIKTTLNDTICTLKSYVDEISRVLTDMSAGNLNIGISGDYRGDFAEIKSSLNNIINSFNNVLNDINIAASQVASGARQVSDSALALSQGSTEQASSIEELSATIEQISSQTRQNAVNASQANELALAARQDAVTGNTQMKEMLNAMEGINTSASNISKIIKVIDEIAFQTNILALNAAVEAARAGQHGKGFAVVAEEVRNLAARSANAAKETTNLIEGSIKKAEDGTKIANNTANALDKIVEGIAKAASLVGEISVSSNEQATGISQVNQGITQVSQVIQTNSATSEESASASEELSSQAEMLNEMVSKFKLKKVDSHSNTYRGLNPDVIKMLEEMAGKKKDTGDRCNTSYDKASASKARISLSDNNYGKY